jgi:NH3-dependent NAD+ synthetase
MMPSPWTAQMSLDDSREMVKRLGVQYDEIAIGPLMEQFAVSLAPTFAGSGRNPPGTPPKKTCRRASAACC